MTREPGDRIGPSRARKVLQRRVDYLTQRIEGEVASDDALAWDAQERKVHLQQIEAITGSMIPNEGDAFVVRRGVGESARIVLVRDGRIVADLRVTVDPKGQGLNPDEGLRVECDGNVVTSWGTPEPVEAEADDDAA